MNFYLQPNIPLSEPFKEKLVFQLNQAYIVLDASEEKYCEGEPILSLKYTGSVMVSCF